MRFLLPLAVCCVSLLSLQRLQALPLQELPPPGPERRLDLLTKLIGQRDVTASASGGQTAIASAPGRAPKWLPGFLRHPPASGARAASPSLARLAGASRLKRRAPRVPRHAHSGSRGGHHYPHHAQLMRVGCVLGTCQVQNLSHRLYQLIGQSGREDSSPINPRSPHSYG